jgi:pyridoxal phosphate enzyme (YggS family)
MPAMTAVSSLAENYARIEERIAAACLAAGRPRDEVALIAVSKMHPAELVEEAVALGQRQFGENRVQEWQGKRAALSPAALARVETHLIGHLQSNKAARAAEIFDAVDSLDSLKLAERLSAAVPAGRALPVVLEIKLSEEQSKEGLAPDGAALAQLLERLPDLRGLRLRGVMTVPPFLEDTEAVRPYFRRLRELRDTLARRHPRLSFATLSMGMSHDFAVAIEEGSTEIRIGTALFGARARPAPEATA